MHLWGESYDEHIENPEDMLNIQSRIAHSIAEQLKAVITPNVRQRLEKIPTNSLTAYDFYWRGRNEHIKYRLDHSNREALEEAEDQYYKALDYDSTFARAYAGLAQVYWDKHYWETYLSVNFMDSVLIYTDMALHYDNQLSDAYSIRGAYNQEIGNNEEALAEFEKAIDYNPNNWEVYWRKGNLYFGIDLLVEAIKNYHKAASLNPGPELPDILIQLGRTYFNAGFFEEGTKYIQNVLILNGDSVAYYNNLSSFAFWSTNYEEAVNLLEKAYALDTSYYYTLLRLGMNYTFNGQYDKALKYFKKYVDRIEELGDIAIIHMHRIGYAYWQNGYKEEAEYYINEQINYCNRMNELGRSLTQQLITYYNLAAAYAFKGERERAYENLNIFIQRDHMAYWAVFWIKNDPLLNSIREEPEFRQIVRDVEAKYQAEHERVRQWLEDNEML
jgi:tetratricopeptide (TPR) repeat protein